MPIWSLVIIGLFVNVHFETVIPVYIVIIDNNRAVAGVAIWVVAVMVVVLILTMVERKSLP